MHRTSQTIVNYSHELEMWICTPGSQNVGWTSESLDATWMCRLSQHGDWFMGEHSRLLKLHIKTDHLLFWCLVLLQLEARCQRAQRTWRVHWCNIASWYGGWPRRCTLSRQCNLVHYSTAYRQPLELAKSVNSVMPGGSVRIVTSPVLNYWHHVGVSCSNRY